MRKTISIALLNIIQGVRGRAFLGVGFALFFVLAFSLFLGELSLGEKHVVLRTVCLVSIELSCLFLIIFGFVYSFYREKEARLQEVYLSYFPMASYLGGKLIGFIGICFIYIVLGCAVSSIFLAFNHAFVWTIALGALSIFLKMAVVCGFCVVFCCLFEYPMVAAIATIFMYISSEFSASALQLHGGSGSVTAGAFKILYHLIPNSDKIDFKYAAVYAQPLPLFYLMHIIIYVVMYIVFSWSLSLVISLKKQL